MFTRNLITMKTYYCSIICLQLLSFVASDSFSGSIGSKQQQSSYDRSSRNVYNSSSSSSNSDYDNNTFNLVSNRSIFVKDRTNFESSSSNNLNYRAGSAIDLDVASSMNGNDDYNRNQQANFLQIPQSLHDHLNGQSINVSNVYPKQKNVNLNSLSLKPLLLRQYQQQQQQPEESQKIFDQPIELNSSFLDLFNDLWNIKNKSGITLIQLEYFIKKKRNIVDKTKVLSEKQKHSNRNEILSNNNIKNQPFLVNHDNKGNGGHETTSNIGQLTINNSKFGNNYKLPGKVFNHLSGTANNLHGTVRNNPQKVLSSVGAQIHNWLLFIQSKLNRMISSISTPFANKQSILQPVRLVSLRQSSTTTNFVVTKSNDDKNLPNNNNAASYSQSSQKGDDITKRLIVKRQALIGNTKLQEKMLVDSLNEEIDNNSKEVKQLCVELDSNSIIKCKTTEAIVNVNLNNTFPGTQKSIEDNCKHIEFLLGSCWPQQLEQISASLASWNESLVSSTDFPLPSPYLPKSSMTIKTNEASNAISCGTAPQVQDIVLDRISWMWLNLCMDKKFRQDYIDNLKCLSFWNQDRAQIVCSNEYKRMQANVAVSSEMIAKTTNSTQPNELNMLRSTTTTTNGNSDGSTTRSRGDRNGELAVIDRELESKTLCCMFDLFLRCVYKQAVKDCSNDGGQFVVSFMSRIGTDDMKYLCNGEPRSINRKSHQSNSTRKGNFSSYEKGPFIESDYCNEPRIYSALHGIKNELYQDKIPSSGKPRPLTAKNRPANINYDPALIGGENEVSESNSGSKVDLEMFYIIITWTFAFSFHFLFLFTLISE